MDYLTVIEDAFISMDYLQMKEALDSIEYTSEDLDILNTLIDMLIETYNCGTKVCHDMFDTIIESGFVQKDIPVEIYKELMSDKIDSDNIAYNALYTQRWNYYGPILDLLFYETPYDKVYRAVQNRNIEELEETRDLFPSGYNPQFDPRGMRPKILNEAAKQDIELLTNYLFNFYTGQELRNMAIDLKNKEELTDEEFKIKEALMLETPYYFI